MINLLIETINNSLGLPLPQPNGYISRLKYMTNHGLMSQNTASSKIDLPSLLNASLEEMYSSITASSNKVDESDIADRSDYCIEQLNQQTAILTDKSTDSSLRDKSFASPKFSDIGAMSPFNHLKFDVDAYELNALPKQFPHSSDDSLQYFPDTSMTNRGAYSMSPNRIHNVDAVRKENNRFDKGIHGFALSKSNKLLSFLGNDDNINGPNRCELGNDLSNAKAINNANKTNFGARNDIYHGNEQKRQKSPMNNADQKPSGLSEREREEVEYWINVASSTSASKQSTNLKRQGNEASKKLVKDDSKAILKSYGDFSTYILHGQLQQSRVVKPTDVSLRIRENTTEFLDDVNSSTTSGKRQIYSSSKVKSNYYINTDIKLQTTRELLISSHSDSSEIRTGSSIVKVLRTGLDVAIDPTVDESTNLRKYFPGNVVPRPFSRQQSSSNDFLQHYKKPLQSIRIKSKGGKSKISKAILELPKKNFTMKRAEVSLESSLELSKDAFSESSPSSFTKECDLPALNSNIVSSFPPRKKLTSQSKQLLLALPPISDYNGGVLLESNEESVNETLNSIQFYKQTKYNDYISCDENSKSENYNVVATGEWNSMLRENSLDISLDSSIESKE